MSDYPAPHVTAAAYALSSPGLPKRYRNGYMVTCPAHPDTNPSLHISAHATRPETLIWHCFAGCSQDEVKHALVALGLHGTRHAPDPSAHRAGALPAPKPQPEPWQERWRWAGAHSLAAHTEAHCIHFELGAPSALWHYAHPRHRERVLAISARYDPPGREREYRPWSWWRPRKANGPVRLFCRAPPNRRLWPYRIEHLAPGHDIVICEGGKTTDAAQMLLPDRLALTWLGGTNYWHHTRWQRVARCARTITLIPDADRQGVRAMNALARHLLALGAVRPRIVTLRRDLPRLHAEDEAREDGWDLGDLWTPRTPERLYATRLDEIERWRRTLPQRHPLALTAHRTLPRPQRP